jgi:hypothetical protein
MKKLTIACISFILVPFLTMLNAQTFINVTFKCNTCPVEGFTDSTHVIQVRGGIQEQGGPGTDWDQTVLKWDASSPEIENIGGDYWQGTIAFPDSFVGKEVNWILGATQTNPDLTTTDVEEYHTGNRIFILPDQDITLDMAYFSNEWNPPYTPSLDSINVYFRVNMSEMIKSLEFDPDEDVLSLVGGFPTPDNYSRAPGDTTMWIPGRYQLQREEVNSTYWSYHLKVDSTSDTYPGDVAGTLTKDSVLYRFCIGDQWSGAEDLLGKYLPKEIWGVDNENRVTPVHGDTTIAWVYWNDKPPKQLTGTDTVELTYRADMSKAIASNGFSAGDTVIVKTGFNSTVIGGVTVTDKMAKQGFSNIYLAKDTIVTDMGTNVNYQYYIVKNGIEYREIFYDFTDQSGDVSSQERRKIYIDATEITVNDIEDDIASLRRMPNFRNLDHLTDSVTVVYTCDLRPAYYQVLAGSELTDIQGNFNVTVADSVFRWGVRINGPATKGVNWQTWGLTLYQDVTRFMYDDGIHGGDVTANDSIYSAVYSYGTEDVVGQEFKFGIKGGDNEGGYGNNHIENIVETGEDTVYVRSQWGSIDPLFYNAWNYTEQRPSGMENRLSSLPDKFQLYQNYPNPFNPTTTIHFDLPKASKVKLIIYNILGQEVIRLADGKLKPGKYVFLWKSMDNYGNRVASGIYFYRLETDFNTDVKKMILIK